MGFTIGSFGADDDEDIRGQAFSPGDPGPDGQGNPGPWPSCSMRSISIGFSSDSPLGRAEVCYIYSVPLDDVSQIGKPDNLVTQSQPGLFKDGTGLFGDGTYFRKWRIAGGTFDPDATYYVYFDIDQTARISDADPYSGFNSYDPAVQNMDSDCLQFLVEMSFGS